MMRAQPASWFEILAARDDATLALAALAATGAVELEAENTLALHPALAALRPLLEEFARLEVRYGAYWPRSGLQPSPLPEAPAIALERSLAAIRAWAPQAEPLIVALQRGDAERAELTLWQRLLAEFGSSPIDFTRLAGAGPVLEARLFSFAQSGTAAFPPAALVRRITLEGTLHALVLAPAADIESLAQQAAALKGRAYAVPQWLRPEVHDSDAYIGKRLARIERDGERLMAQLIALHHRHGMHRALGDAARLQWMMHNVRALKTGEYFAWITGWTSDGKGTELAAALERSGARALLHFPPPPPGAKPPLLLRNPWWARPFEIFARALGMPSRNEADPSQLLALAVPLMFGYMFGDLGQGLVLALSAFALRKRWPLARLFIAGGLSAALFGVLFGSVFSLPGVLPALWIDPIDSPLTILLAPLAGGVLLLAIGLLVNGMEAYWRGKLRDWLLVDAWLLVSYFGILLGLVEATAYIFTGAGVLMFCFGSAWLARRASAGFSALAEIVERTLQLLINTLSFARVGAFALAHAGLSSAIVALMEAGESALVKGLVLILGNALVLGLETLVVSIQTTRLVLFEFFTRFLVAQGRPFRPLPAPPLMSLSREN